MQSIYKIKEGESPFDFELCQCGGELLLVNDIDDYFEHIDEYLDAFCFFITKLITNLK